MTIEATISSSSPFCYRQSLPPEQIKFSDCSSCRMWSEKKSFPSHSANMPRCQFHKCTNINVDYPVYYL